MARKVTVIPANPTSGSKAAGGGKKTRVAAYCRVSTDHEEQEGSFKNQVDYYTKLIEKTPGWELAGIFADDGISGTGTKKRSGFMDMIAACEQYGLRTPEFRQAEDFRTIIFRKTKESDINEKVTE